MSFDNIRLLAANVQIDRLRSLADSIEDAPEAVAEIRAAADNIAFLSAELTPRLRKSELAPEVRTFKKYIDAGHGWVAAKVDFLAELGVLDSVSVFSRRKGATVYLEEDRDAGLLFAALDALGQEYDTNVKYHDGRSPIRSYPSAVEGADRPEHVSVNAEADALEAEAVAAAVRDAEVAEAERMSEGLPAPVLPEVDEAA